MTNPGLPALSTIWVAGLYGLLSAGSALAFPMDDQTGSFGPSARESLSAPDAQDLRHQMQIVGGATAPASSGGWIIVPRIDVMGLITDNALQVSNPRQWDLATIISPGISATADTTRLQLRFDYSPILSVYARTTSQNALSHFLNASGLLTIVPEMVFAFDGDRAGRAAAWRALNNALPEAREGRQLRFLFLPDGQDPDSLVGAEGREAFEARLEGALPLSEYLVQEIASQADLAHADGRARFAELARPLVAKVPDGVYRELLVERLAEAIRLPAARLRSLWETADAPSQGGGGRGTTVSGTPFGGGPRAAAKTGQSAGRGNLMRQAVQGLVHHPRIATRLDPTHLAALETLQEPGADILRALIVDLRAQPITTTAQLLERWRDRPESERLARLATAESLMAGEDAALRELQTALERMQREGGRRRLDSLLERERDGALSATERQELQGLLAGQKATRPAT